MMDLAVYHPWVHCRGGGEKVILKLLEQSRHNITIYTNRFVPEDTYSELANNKIIEIFGLPIVGELFRGTTFALGAAITSLPVERHDALVVSTGGVAEMINFRNSRLPLLGFCHTPLRVAHDEKIRRQKLETMGPVKRTVYEMAIRGYELVEEPSWRRFDHVMFNSETTRQRALSSALIDEALTSVVYPGANTEGNESTSYGDYFFYPSRFAYYKRQDLALDAYERFRERNPGTNFRLVVAGGVNEEKRSYFKKVKERATNIKGVKVRSNVPGDQWGALYSNAYAVLFCAMNEDWGITPIEAGSYEKPVISVNEGGPTESIVDGETGILVNDADEMVDAMERVTSNERLTRSMGTQAKKRSRKYTWERFVAQFDETVSEVVTRFESSAGQ